MRCKRCGHLGGRPRGPGEPDGGVPLRVNKAIEGRTKHEKSIGEKLQVVKFFEFEMRVYCEKIAILCQPPRRNHERGKWFVTEMTKSL